MWSTPSTRASLLLRIRDARDDRAWDGFVELYAPIIYGHCRSRGLQDADASDILQEVLQAVARGIDGLDYEPSRGRFRDWLFTITRRRIADYYAKAESREVRGGTAVRKLLENLPDDEAEEAWRRAWDLQLFNWAAIRVRGQFREATWRAFWETTVRLRPAVEVGEEIGMSVGAVYIAKSRVLARLRALIDVEEGTSPAGGQDDDREPTALSG